MKLAFEFADGVRYETTGRSGVTALDSALGADVPVLYQCRSGSCGTCVARLESGEAPMMSGVSSSLLKSEREAGLRLTCQALPGSDCVFSFDYDSALGEAEPERYESNIESLDWVANDVVKLRLELPTDDWFEFTPGQFVQVRVPGTDEWRSYSMASSVREMPSFELYIRILPAGVMSDYLKAEAEVGDLVEIEGPFGSFRLRKSKAPHIFIAGGTGLAPFLSMFDEIRQYSGTKPPLLLSFGCASDAGLFCREELEDAAFVLPTLETRISVDHRFDPDTDARIGDPVSALGPEDIADDNTVAYLCGPPAMIEAGRSKLIELGVDPENIFSEQFVSTGGA